jgi:hypothetical protein
MKKLQEAARRYVFGFFESEGEGRTKKADASI